MAAHGALSVEYGVVQIQTVDNEDAAVDGDLRKGSKKKKAPGSQPRGATGYTRGEGCPEYGTADTQRQETAANVNL